MKGDESACVPHVDVQSLSSWPSARYVLFMFAFRAIINGGILQLWDYSEPPQLFCSIVEGTNAVA
jgi:hypothetical protein